MAGGMGHVDQRAGIVWRARGVGYEVNTIAIP
jgi:hypothetical protein